MAVNKFSFDSTISDIAFVGKSQMAVLFDERINIVKSDTGLHTESYDCDSQTMNVYGLEKELFVVCKKGVDCLDIDNSTKTNVFSFKDSLITASVHDVIDNQLLLATQQDTESKLYTVNRRVARGEGNKMAAEGTITKIYPFNSFEIAVGTSSGSVQMLDKRMKNPVWTLSGFKDAAVQNLYCNLGEIIVQEHHKITQINASTGISQHPLTLSNEHKCVGLLFGDFREHYHFLFSSVKNCYLGIVGRNKYEVDSTKYFHRWHAHPRHPHIFTKLGRELIATSDGSNVVLQYGNICVEKKEFKETSEKLRHQYKSAKGQEQKDKLLKKGIEDTKRHERELEKKKYDAPSNYSIFTDAYETIRNIDKGTFGIVKEAKSKKTGRSYAVKILENKEALNEKFLVERELSHWSFSHKNVVSCIDVMSDGTSKYIIRELMMGILYDLLKEQGCIDEEESARVMKDISKGLQYLAGKKLVHRDIKPKNLLYHVKSGNKKLYKLGDMGLVTNFKATTFCGTVDYMSPERFLMKKYSFATDIWAAGVVMFQMTTGKLPLNHQHKDWKYWQN
ncbi:hypothetical protein GCK72_006374 [Caenorhabditis remanei]|uniref:mitogen-activated protein kinase kinase n=1 Tax=Caenorhabditis remanei TaxID=31234 RepID=A0A6A5HIG5_CAERE|nr:hypothetical protein GCK72_006374 [Caenorhabditis remanei]KAF1766417.1 hypothetical protein GCK72_006374 [Caenorhabditis remanei]